MGDGKHPEQISIIPNFRDTIDSEGFVDARN